MKISLSENVFPGFYTPFERKSKCLKLVKYFPFFSDLASNFLTVTHFFHIDYFTKCKVKISQKQ